MTDSNSSTKKRLRIGDVLVQSGIITSKDVDDALSYSREMNLKLGQAVVALGLASEADICIALGQQLLAGDKERQGRGGGTVSADAEQDDCRP